MKPSEDPNLDTMLKRLGRIEHQLRWLMGMARELLLAKEILRSKENRKLLKRLKKANVSKVLPKLLKQLEGKVV